MQLMESGDIKTKAHQGIRGDEDMQEKFEYLRVRVQDKKENVRRLERKRTEVSEGARRIASWDRMDVLNARRNGRLSGGLGG